MDNQEKKLFLLDAMALIYRAHFAFSKNPLINSKGMSTGATLGFTNSLLEILLKEKPSHLAVAFDTNAPTFRHESYVEYKAQRQAQPEDIRIAIPYVKQILDAFNIRRLELDGFEADDIIGTIAKKAVKEGFKIYMMTPDKDFAQLVEENILLYKPSYMGNAVDILGVNEVRKKFGIEKVDQVRDILALQGDSIDNIPGIPGVGEKTAVKLIAEFGSVENLIANVDQLTGKLRERVETFGAQGLLSKELATINIQVPLECTPEDCKVVAYNEEKLRQLFEELEFRTLAKRVFSQNSGTGIAPAPKQLSLFGEESAKADLDEEIASFDSIDTITHQYSIINTAEERKSLIEHLKKQPEICFDTETTSLDTIDAILVGISFSYQVHEAYYLPIPFDTKQAKVILDEFREIFENEKIIKVGHNLKFDMLVLKNYGIDVRGKLIDTIVVHYLLEPDARHSMDLLAGNYLKYKPIPIEELIGKKGLKQGNMKDVALEKIAEYASEDADITLQLRHQLFPKLKESNLEKLYNEIEAPLIPVLSGMEREGVKVDKGTLKALSIELAEEALKIEREIFDCADCEFNISSPKQLGEILFERMKLIEKPKKTRSGQYATGEEILGKLAVDHEIARKILDYREVQKLKSTYIDSLPSLINPTDGRIHTSYNQTVAATGRLSSNNPNLQNIPIRTEKGREIRKAFVPRNEDYQLISADYSQVELRIMASISKDESMIEAFREGRDIHMTTASRIFGVPLEEVTSDMRRKAKTANFGIIYGISAFGLSERLEIPRKEAAAIIEAYFKEFPAVKKYMDRVISEAKEREYVETLFGRRRYLRDINSRNMTMRGFAERNAINAPIQGTAADIIKIAMINIHDWMNKNNLKSKMILQVHDELVFDAHRDELEFVKENIIKMMQNAATLEVPLIVDAGVGNNWLEAH